MVQLLEVIRICSTWLLPFMPNAIEQVYKQLNILTDVNNVDTSNYKWGYFKEGMTLNEPEPIFPRKQ